MPGRLEAWCLPLIHLSPPPGHVYTAHSISHAMYLGTDLGWHVLGRYLGRYGVCVSRIQILTDDANRGIEDIGTAPAVSQLCYTIVDFYHLYMPSGWRGRYQVYSVS
jgi:hypothetical protein